LSDFNDISYVGRLWCPEMIPDIETFLSSPFSKWPPQYRTRSDWVIIVESQMSILFPALSWQEHTRYDYNLTIMKSPKPATGNRFKK
jgi:hypothetical protein